MATHWLDPASCRIAELGLVSIVVRHGEKAQVDLPLLATADTIHRRFHVIVDASARDAAKDAEAVPMGIEHRSHRGAIDGVDGSRSWHRNVPHWVLSHEPMKGAIHEGDYHGRS